MHWSMKGLLRREKGRGTFVAEPKILEGLLQTPYGFTDSMKDQGILFATACTPSGRGSGAADGGARTAPARQMHP